jgi:hypothetical protein
MAVRADFSRRSHKLEAAGERQMSDDKTSLFCNRCRGRTNHALKGSYVHRWKSPDDDDIQGEVKYNLWVCAGCETGVLEISESDSESYFPDGTTEIRTEYFPKRMHEGLVPKTFRKLGATLEKIYSETIECFNAGSLILATAGLRALLEGVCEDKRVTGRNLMGRINNLRTLLPNDNIVKALHHFRFTGNEAVHKLKAPKVESVKLAIDVMEDLLNYLYEMEYKVVRLTKAEE